MADLEKNKLFAAIILSGTIITLTNVTVNILYEKDPNGINTSYNLEISEEIESTTENKQETVDINSLLLQGDSNKGKTMAKKCISCHSFSKEETGTRIGPNLWNIVNRKIASKANFSYSKAMKTKQSEKWTEENLFYFLLNPKKYIPQTRMVFPGIKQKEKLANIITYLKTLK